MIHVEKKRLSKQALIIIILSAVLVLLVTAAIITKIVVDKIDDTPADGYTPPEIMSGEGTYAGFAVAFPYVGESQIVDVSITSHNGSYRILRPNADKSESFRIYYTPKGSDKEILYSPGIVDSEADFDYTTLYSIVEDTGYGIPKISYLCSAVGTLYFEERIERPEGISREEFFAEYGLDDASAEVITYGYYDSEGELSAHRIKVGDKTVTGTAYYYAVADSNGEGYRDYVYVSRGSQLDYALGGVSSLINAMLVAEGLEQDSYLEPYLTTGYKQWVTKYHDDEGETVAADSNVLADATVKVPLNPSTLPENYTGDGYVYELAGDGSLKYTLTSYDLAKYAGLDEYLPLIRALQGKTVGSYIGNEIVITLASELTKTVNVPEGGSVDYVYTITAIEAILDNGELTEAGAPVGESKLVKVTYTAKAGGVSITPIAHHAVLDLSSPYITDSTRAEFAGAAIGELSPGEEIVFSVSYDENMSNKVVAEMILDEIVAIYDSEGRELETVASDSVVMYRYYFKVDGKAGEMFSSTIDLSEITEGDALLIKEQLIGKECSDDIGLTLSSYTQYPEIMSDFMTVTVNNIRGYVTSELTVAFKYENADKIDPFYGESIYVNMLPGKYSSYGLNSSTCQTVVELLGGITEVAGKSEGLYGSEVLTVGLTPEVLLEYGFYDDEAYRIYFELPRLIFDSTEENSEYTEYSWYDTIGFTLYISAELEDGTRYVASDMYDIVTKISKDKLVFLNYDFVDFWARRMLMLFDVSDLEALEVEFMMEDIFGKYLFELTHNDIYIDEKGNRYTTPADDRTFYDFIEIILTEAEGSMETEFSKYLEKYGLGDAANFAEFYNMTYGGGKPSSIQNDTADVAYFKSLLQLIYMTAYTDSLTEEEQEEAMKYDVIMRMSVDISGTSDKYVYEFRRFDDRRVMVSLSRVSSGGTVRHTVSDFYLSSFATRKIVSGFMSLLSGESVNGSTDDGYN